MSADLVDVHVDLPNHWGASGETLRARPLGNDTYALQSIPFYAYDLNVGDHVIARAATADLVPEIERVTARSGHHTLRVIFFDATSLQQRIGILDSLADLHVTYEGASEKYYALDLSPGADVGAVRARLEVYEEDGSLQYETCEAKVPGSFDDAAE